MALANDEVVRSFLSTLGEGDLAATGRLLTDDVTWHVPGKHALSGDKHGRDEAVETLRKFAEFNERAGVRPEMHDLLASDEHVVVLIQREFSGATTRAVLVFHVGDGRISEIWQHEADQDVIDRALSG